MSSDHRSPRVLSRRVVCLLACCLFTAMAVAPSATLASPMRRVPAVWGTKEADGPAITALRARVNHMSLMAKVGQIFMVSFPSTVVTQPLVDWLRGWQVGGIILFSRNVEGDAQVAALISGANRIATAATGSSLLVGIDQEGGVVRRIFFGPSNLPSASYYGSLGVAGPVQLYHDAYNSGLALHRLGITINFAPVCDLLTNSYSPIASRSYGPDPLAVSQLVAAAVRGYQDAGVAATAKHFLGLGNTGIDAHNDLPTVTVSRAWLEGHDMVPFRAAIKAGVAAIMTTHVVVPALDATGAPADLSQPILSGVIRGELGFRGLIVADSLLMGAVTFHLGVAESAVRAVQAGNDLILLAQSKAYPPEEMHAALHAVAAAVRSGRIPMGRLNDAVLHVLTLKAREGLLKP